MPEAKQIWVWATEGGLNLLGLLLCLVVIGRTLQIMDLSVKFTYHPIFMAFSFAFCMPQGVVLLTGEKSIVGLISYCGVTMNRAMKVQVHSFLQFAAVFSYIVGFLAIYLHKEDLQKQHFTSWHSWLGAAAVAVGLVANFLLGLVLYFSNTAKPWLEKSGEVDESFVKRRSFGLGALAIGLALWESGWTTNTENWPSELLLLTKAGIVVISVTTLLVGFRISWKSVESIFPKPAPAEPATPANNISV